MIDEFCVFLKKKEMSPNTIQVYRQTIDMFYKVYKALNKTNVLAFKGYLLEQYKPRTVNLRIQAMNKYLTFIKKEDLKLTAVKIQQKPFLENVISNADYDFLRRS